jgi:membrane dipeptidase
VKRADDQISAIRALAENHPETWQLATSAADVRRAVQDGKIAALMGLEGGYAIDEKLENVQRYYDLGVRYMSPAWSVSTSWAGSSGDDIGASRGLNVLGYREYVDEAGRGDAFRLPCDRKRTAKPDGRHDSCASAHRRCS